MGITSRCACRLRRALQTADRHADGGQLYARHFTLVVAANAGDATKMTFRTTVGHNGLRESPPERSS
jgi:hypothetical protein